MTGKIRALLATARIANVPSVVSNTAVGVLLAGGFAAQGLDWPWALFLACVMFYVAGNFFNDWADRHWDRHHRPERALPRGLFSATGYFLTGLVLTITGLVITAFHGLECLIVSLVLVGLIVIYTNAHKHTVYAVIPMGMCRACLPLIGFLGVRADLNGWIALPALALFIYVMALSWSARYESRGDAPAGKKWQIRGWLVFSGLVAAIYPLVQNPLLGWIGLSGFGLWLALSLTKYQKPVSAHVSALLAGIPLIDWVLLFPLAVIGLSAGSISAGSDIFLVALLLPPLAFVLGRLLQRVAPAT